MPAPIRRTVVVALLASLALIAVIVLPGDDGPVQTVYVNVRDADSLIEGQAVRIGGETVGNVASVETADGGRRARIALDLDDRAWPLRRNAKFLVRWGGTVAYASRYVDLTPGSSDAPAVADGAVMPASVMTVPVEYDQFVATFDKQLRGDVQQLLDNGGPALAAAERPLAKTLSKTPAALKQVGRALSVLVEDRDRLDVLLRSASDTVAAIDQADPGLRSLLSDAGTTLTATAARAQELGATLKDSPATFANVRDTLKRADPTLRTVSRLATRLDEGVDRLRKITPPLNSVLETVQDVGPDAASSLATVRRATTDLNPLLTKATALMPTIDSIGQQLTEQLPCLRPYTPDIVSFLTNWGDFISSTDGKDHYFRANPQVLLPATTNTQALTSGAAAKAYPGLRFSFPQPPGGNAGKPWFQPKCGVTEASLDPAKDPEARGTVAANERVPGASNRGAGR